MLSDKTIQAFKAQHRGPVVEPGHAAAARTRSPCATSRPAPERKLAPPTSSMPLVQVQNLYRSVQFLN